MNLAWTDAQRILAIFVPVAFVVVIVMLMYRSGPPSADNTLYGFIGVLGTMATTVITYYFGSSKGSAEKDVASGQTLTKLVDKVTGTGDGKVTQ